MEAKYRLTKKVADMTREEIVSDITRFVDPEVIGTDSICIVFHVGSEHPLVAFKLRDDVYYRADIELSDLHVDGLAAEYEQSTREAFVEEMMKELNAMTTPALIQKLIGCQTLAYQVGQVDFYKKLRSEEAAQEIIKKLETNAEKLKAKMQELKEKKEEE